jgi:hypothetical protein
MKRGINFYEAFFLFLLYFKATNTTFFGSVPSLFFVAAPLLWQEAVRIVKIIIEGKAWDKQFEFWIWKTLLSRKIKKKSNGVQRSMGINHKSANPGRYTDPADSGK